MNKSAFIAAYERFRKQYRLTIKEAVVSAGGALVMFGLRKETEDVDLDVPTELYDRLKRKLCKDGLDVKLEPNGDYVKTYKEATLVQCGGAEYLRIGDCSLHRGLREDVKVGVYGGVCCYCPEEVLKQKEGLQRPVDNLNKIEQDQFDIANLKSMLKKSA